MPPPFTFTLTTLLLLTFITISYQHEHEHEPDTTSPITRYQTYLRFNTTHPNPNYTRPINFLLTRSQTLNLNSQIFHYTDSKTKTKSVLLLTWPGSKPDLPSILFNSHLDSVPAEPDKWIHPPFSATLTSNGNIYARGAQDDKCISIQYLEAIRNLKSRGFELVRTVHLSYVPEEEIGGFDGAMSFVPSKEFDELNVGFAVDEGQASVNDEFRVFYADRSPWHVTIKAVGKPGHGSSLFDGSAFENLMESLEMMRIFRDEQFELVKSGLKVNSEVVSVNPVFVNAGIQTGDGYAMNMQPSEAEAGFDIRIPPTVDGYAMNTHPSEPDEGFDIRIPPTVDSAYYGATCRGVGSCFQEHAFQS